MTRSFHGSCHPGWRATTCRGWACGRSAGFGNCYLHGQGFIAAGSAVASPEQRRAKGTRRGQAACGPGPARRNARVRPARSAPPFPPGPSSPRLRGRTALPLTVPPPDSDLDPSDQRTHAPDHPTARLQSPAAAVQRDRPGLPGGQRAGVRLQPGRERGAVRGAGVRRAGPGAGAARIRLRHRAGAVRLRRGTAVGPGLLRLVRQARHEAQPGGRGRPAGGRGDRGAGRAPGAAAGRRDRRPVLRGAHEHPGAGGDGRDPEAAHRGAAGARGQRPAGAPGGGLRPGLPLRRAGRAAGLLGLLAPVPHRLRARGGRAPQDRRRRRHPVAHLPRDQPGPVRPHRAGGHGAAGGAGLRAEPRAPGRPAGGGAAGHAPVRGRPGGGGGQRGVAGARPGAVRRGVHRAPAGAAGRRHHLPAHLRLQPRGRGPHRGADPARALPRHDHPAAPRRRRLRALARHRAGAGRPRPRGRARRGPGARSRSTSATRSARCPRPTSSRCRWGSCSACCWG